jgi:SagB-type dehydrogenase family enzyme
MDSRRGQAEDGTTGQISPGQADATSNIKGVLAYHQLSKHHLQRYAQALGYLDWATQPDPFRTFAGTATIPLPLLADALQTPFGDLHRPGVVSPRRADANSIAILFELALGLSAWKEAGGARWALRCNPSSGNLHPTEGYAVLPSLPGVDPGVYHYLSRMHALERRRSFSADEAARLGQALPPGAFLIGLTSIHWREAWKYGVRAYRYCQHDVGHALAAFRYAAAVLGWSAKLLDHLGDNDAAGWLGLDQTGFADLDPLDREHPDVLLLIGPAPLPDSVSNLLVPGGEWLGNANRLSPGHVRWEEVETVARAAWKPATEPIPRSALPALPPLPPGVPISAAALIRQRRSCLALDGHWALDAAVFYRILDHLLPRLDVPPWDLLPWNPLVHLGVFVHRVGNLAPGLYLLERSATVHDELKAACPATFLWQRPVACPDHLPFYLLTEGDYRDTARTVSCHQDIAADGAFSLGMLAAFGPTIRERGAWWYRRLFWEAGMLGQVLYLEAEAAGARGTGIGCYFDDAFHRLLGLKGDAWQDIYHFTIGGAVEDARLRTIAPYAHLTGR